MGCAFCELECNEYCHPACAKEYHEREDNSLCTVCGKEIDIGGTNPHKPCVGAKPQGYPTA